MDHNVQFEAINRVVIDGDFYDCFLDTKLVYHSGDHYYLVVLDSFIDTLD